MSGKRTLLVIDDDAGFRSEARAMLRDTYDVLDAATLAGGRNVLRSTSPDIVLLDKSLPDGDGVRLLEELALKEPHIAWVMISVDEGLQSAVAALHAGAVDYVGKSDSWPMIAARIARAIEKRSEYVRRRFLDQERGGGEMDPAALVGDSPAMIDLRDRIARAAETRSSVLITGESGTGKELVARAIHAASAVGHREIIALDLQAITPGLEGDALYGHVRGAFNDAVRDRLGAVEAADGSTLFLDEIGNLSLEQQAGLLRVLATRAFRRLGDDMSKERHSEFRLIAATNRDLREDVTQGRFRQDLFYRVGRYEIDVPPLRERLADVPQLVELLADRLRWRLGREVVVAEAAVHRLATWDYRENNVRELESFLETLAIDHREGIEDRHVQALLEQRRSGTTTLASRFDVTPYLHLPYGDAKRRAEDDFVTAYVEHFLRLAEGRVAKAAERMGIRCPPQLFKIMKRLGIAGPRSRPDVDATGTAEP